MHKIIGTAVPLGALRSNKANLRHETNGTVDTGLLFLDWLKRTGQSAWQLLPLSETHLESVSKSVHVPSPYKGYGIGLDPRYLSSDMTEVDPSPDEERTFKKENADWLKDYALFSALRDEFGTDDWSEWPRPIRVREPDAITEWKRKLNRQVTEKVREQWRLHVSFSRLKQEARRKGIFLYGDLPFYLPFRSPLVWAHHECFDILKTGKMSWVSGVPNGPRSYYGRQVWGHPLYRWKGPGQTKRILKLWKMRAGYYSRFYDAMRLDHAKGFFNFGAISTKRKSLDTIRLGPGRRALTDIISFCRNHGLELFAEDSGDRLEELRETLYEFDVPGIRIFRWAYNEKRKRLKYDYSNLSNYPKTSFVFTTTHDTMPLKRYIKSLTANEKAHLCIHVGVENSRSVNVLIDRIIGAVINSPAERIIIPLQDWLHTENRINVPGTETKRNDPNWRYRIEKPVEKLPDIGLIPKFSKKKRKPRKGETK
ncbi:MAG: 4-alpha-glucanotransferase [Patescibacteria group bacterium]|nr:4-alpha-glucanotransferase [Patescibacteria group bacterium]